MMSPFTNEVNGSLNLNNQIYTDFKIVQIRKATKLF